MDEPRAEKCQFYGSRMTELALAVHRLWRRISGDRILPAQLTDRCCQEAGIDLMPGDGWKITVYEEEDHDGKA